MKTFDEAPVTARTEKKTTELRSPAFRGERLCPACGQPGPIDPGGALWPLSWRCTFCGAGLRVRNGVAILAPELDGTDDGFDTRFHGFLADAEDGHFWFEERNRLIAWLLRRLDGLPVDVLEVGCGTGFVLQEVRAAFPGARVAGSELHSDALAFARRRHATGTELVQMDARRLHVIGALDLVCAFDVIEHISEDEKAIASIYQALRPGGHLVATVPQHPWLWSASDDIGHHARRYRRGELQAKVRRAGFEVIYSDSFTSLLLPFMALSRLSDRLGRQRQLTDREIIEREFCISPALNAALRLVLRIEHFLRRLGIRFPAGGSRVIIAKKP